MPKHGGLGDGITKEQALCPQETAARWHKIGGLQDGRTSVFTKQVPETRREESIVGNRRAVLALRS